MLRDWDRLRVFDAVARRGSIREAAEELRLSGSAVSQQIRKLERDLGQRVFEPAGRGIRPTAAGSLLARRARTIARQLNQIQEDLSRLADDIAGPLRIGGMMTALPSVLAPAMDRLTTEHPHLEPTLTDGEAAEFVDQLRVRDLDAALIETWQSNAYRSLSSMTTTLILDEPVDLAVPTSLEPRPETVEGASDHPWVVCPVGSGSYQTVAEIGYRAGIEPNIRYQITSYPSQLDLIAAGLAVGLLPRLAQPAVPHPDVCFIELRPAIRRQLQLVTRRGDDRPAVLALTEALLQQTAVASTGQRTSEAA